MRYSTTLLTCAALLLGTSVLNAETVPLNGADDKIEWQVRSNWQISGKPKDIVHSLDGKMVFILDASQRVLVYDNKGQLLGRIPVGVMCLAVYLVGAGLTLGSGGVGGSDFLVPHRMMVINTFFWTLLRVSAWSVDV